MEIVVRTEKALDALHAGSNDTLLYLTQDELESEKL